MAKVGPKREPIATPSTWLKNVPSKYKSVYGVAKRNSLVNLNNTWDGFYLDFEKLKVFYKKTDIHQSQLTSQLRNI